MMHFDFQRLAPPSRLLGLVRLLQFSLAVIGSGNVPALAQAAEPGGATTSFSINAAEVVGANRGFWKALGHDFLFKIVNEPEGHAFLDRALKENTVRYYRTHYTFSNTTPVDARAGGQVGGRTLHVGKDGKYLYDFSIVNATFRELTRRGMKPIVEFDFYPDGLRPTTKRARAANAENFSGHNSAPADWNGWQTLMDKFMENLIREFGVAELRTWYFEVWNEPDAWPESDLSSFYRLYDLFAHTIKACDAQFKVGGPACFNLFFLKGFLEHVVNGANAVTGKRGSPIDFVSFHSYAVSGGILETPGPVWQPQVSKIVADMLWWQRLMKRYPQLQAVEIHLNEWGLCSHGDSKFVDKYPELEYRNSEVSGLFMLKLVDCLYALEDNYKFRTSLMLYWGAWFNAATGPMFMGSRDLMTNRNIPKPVYAAYGMLAKLGPERLAITRPAPGGRLGALATRSPQGIQVLIYDFNEQDDQWEKSDNIAVAVSGLSGYSKVNVEEIAFDRVNHNTYRKWEGMGRPAAGDAVVGALMREAELTPNRSYAVNVTNGEIRWSDRLRRHSSKLYLISREPAKGDMGRIK